MKAEVRLRSNKRGKQRKQTSLCHTWWAVTASKALYSCGWRWAAVIPSSSAFSNLILKVEFFANYVATTSFTRTCKHSSFGISISQWNCMYQEPETVPMTHTPLVFLSLCRSHAYGMGLSSMCMIDQIKWTQLWHDSSFLVPHMSYFSLCDSLLHIGSISLEKPIWQGCEMPC